MKFQDNFSEILLIAEEPVTFYISDANLKDNFDFHMRLINLKDSFINPYIQNALALCHMSSADWRSKTHNQHSSLWEMLKLYKFNRENILVRNIKYFLCFLLQEQFEDNNGTWSIKRIEIDQILFERICEIALVSAGLKKFNDQSQFQAYKPQWLIDKEAEIQRIKNGNKKQTSNNSQYEELLKIIMPLNYELGYTFDELFNMNYFHIQALTKFVPKIIGYDIQKRQIMSKKKIKYITDK